MAGRSFGFPSVSRPHPGSKTQVFAPFWGDAKKKEQVWTITALAEVKSF
jgi:hypothetical protein